MLETPISCQRNVSWLTARSKHLMCLCSAHERCKSSTDHDWGPLGWKGYRCISICLSSWLERQTLWPRNTEFLVLLSHCKNKKKREENEFNSIYLLIYSLLSRKNQQTLGVSDNKITKKNICCLEGYTYIVCCEARKLFWHINREDILPERKKKTF